MKKELAAIGCLLALAAFSFWNLIHLKDLICELETSLETSVSFAEAEDWDSALLFGEKTAVLWERAENYTEAVLRHPELDAVEDALRDYLAELYRQDAGGAKGMAQKLSAHLDCLYDMERISLRSIL